MDEKLGTLRAWMPSTGPACLSRNKGELCTLFRAFVWITNAGAHSSRWEVTFALSESLLSASYCISLFHWAPTFVIWPEQWATHPPAFCNCPSHWCPWSLHRPILSGRKEWRQCPWGWWGWRTLNSGVKARQSWGFNICEFPAPQTHGLQCFSGFQEAAILPLNWILGDSE